MKLVKLEVTGDYEGTVYQCIEDGQLVGYRDENGDAVDFEDLVVEMTVADKRPAKPKWAE